MLEYLRDVSNKPVAKILMGVLIFSFVGWGVADWIFSGGRRDSVVATVGGTEIGVKEFTVEKSRALAKLSREQQKQVYTDPVFANQFYGKVLSDMINDVMIRNHAHDMGFVVTDKRVAAEIKTFPEFSEGGEFSPFRFGYILSQSGFTENQFAEYLRGTILRGYTLGAMSMPVTVPNFTVNAAYNARYGERAIEYSTVKFEDFKAGNPTEAQLKEFYAKNPKTVAETRTVSYVLVPAKMDAPDTYDAGYKKAQQIEDDIIAGESMAKTADRLKAKFVSLPAFARDNRPVDTIINDVILSKIFNMDAGMESEIIETKQGFVILRVDNINAAHTAEFNSVKDKLVAGWKREEQKKHAYVRANELLVDLKAGTVLKSAKSATVSRASGAPNDVLVAAFANTIGTSTIVPSSDAFYVLSVKKEIAPKADAAKQKALRAELEKMANREIMDDYNSYLMREYPVKINKKTLDKMTTH